MVVLSRSCAVSKHWDFLHEQLKCPAWLSWLYSSSALSGVDGSSWLSPFRALVSHLMFGHLKLSVELATAFLSAQQRLEFILDGFPEFSAIAEVIAAVQVQAGALQSRALSVWVDVTEGYPDAYRAVTTRHAAVLLLHFQQAEIRSLHATGMLEQREYDFILSLISQKLLRLERRGLEMRMTDALELFFALPFIQALTPTQQRRLRLLLHDKGVRRRTFEAHHILFGRRQVSTSPTLTTHTHYQRCTAHNHNKMDTGRATLTHCQGCSRASSNAHLVSCGSCLYLLLLCGFFCVDVTVVDCSPRRERQVCSFQCVVCCVSSTTSRRTPSRRSRKIGGPLLRGLRSRRAETRSPPRRAPSPPILLLLLLRSLARRPPPLGPIVCICTTPSAGVGSSVPSRC